MKGPLPRVHAVTDEAVARRSNLDAVARALVDAGGDDVALHARGRGLPGREHYELARRLPGRRFVNDRLDVALAVGAAGVHLGHGSLGVAAARRLGPEWWIGRSVHDLAEARAALAIGGVTPARAPELRAAGAYGVAAIRALWDASDPGRAARELLEVFA